jgi:hypothetical protein
LVSECVSPWQAVPVPVPEPWGLLLAPVYPPKPLVERRQILSWVPVLES